MLKSSLLFALAVAPSMVVGQQGLVSSIPGSGQTVAPPTQITVTLPQPVFLEDFRISLSNAAGGTLASSLGPTQPTGPLGTPGLSAVGAKSATITIPIPASINFTPGMVVRVGWFGRITLATPATPASPSMPGQNTSGTFDFRIQPLPAPPKLMASSPASNAILTAQPSAIVLTFNTAVDPTRSTISVRFKATQSATGKALPPPQTLHTSAFTASPDKTKLTATLTNPGDPGEFTVTWQAATAGGAVVSGTFTFSQR